MVAGVNKVFCGTENGVCELTKDTVYVHPSAKQCSWTPSSTGSPFTQVATFGSGENIKFTLSNITRLGMYFLRWRFQLTSNRYGDNVLSAYMLTDSGNSYKCYIHTTGIPNDTSDVYEITTWINVPYFSSYNFAMVIDGTGIQEDGYERFRSIELRLSAGASQLYNGNSFNTLSGRLYYLTPS